MDALATGLLLRRFAPALASIVILFVSGTIAGSASSQTNWVRNAQSAPKTEFIEDAKLSQSELLQVMALAKACGIKEVASVQTSHMLPSVARGIIVTSRERISGRDISYDILEMKRVGWESGQPRKNSPRRGNFWADQPLYTKHQRTFSINGKTVRLVIGDIDVAIADKIMRLLTTKKVRAENEFQKDWEKFDLSEANALRRNTWSGTSDYELWFWKSQEILHLKLEGEVIIITGTGVYNI